MKRKFIILTFLLATLTLSSCGKEEVIDEIVEQGEVGIDENRFIQILSDSVKESIDKHMDFTINVYEDMLSSDNLSITYEYDRYSMALHTYYYDTGLETYEKSTAIYWINPKDRLTYLDISFERKEDIRIKNYIPLVNPLIDNLSLGEEKIVNATNCFTLVSTAENETIEYYLSQDEYILIGAKFINNKTNKETYRMLNYSSAVKFSGDLNDAIRESFDEYLKENN